MNTGFGYVRAQTVLTRPPSLGPGNEARHGQSGGTAFEGRLSDKPTPTHNVLDTMCVPETDSNCIMDAFQPLAYHDVSRT